jgi:hypothetical protein
MKKVAADGSIKKYEKENERKKEAFLGVANTL